MTEDTCLDVIGVPVVVGAIVATSRSNEMEVCEVMRLCPKKIRVRRLGAHGYEWTCYPHDTAVLAPDAVMAYRLRGTRNN